ncbi:MAG: GNAT family N-acetyltransferase [Acidobacteria bacterium]|nr:GNAT family N-acetyltransferase [Acidobacteriota bacterium]
MDLSFRKATAKDTSACIDLVYSSGPELLEYMFSTQAKTAKDYIAYEFEQGGGFIGHQIHTVVEHKSTIVGVGAFYDRKQLVKLYLETLKNIIRFYGLFKSFNVLRNALDSASVIEKPRPNGMYICNLGVSAQSRGLGIGSALINYETEKARKKSYKEMSLDVATNNPKAERLYKRLGFNLVKEKTFQGRANIPGTRFLVSPIIY